MAQNDLWIPEILSSTNAASLMRWADNVVEILKEVIQEASLSHRYHKLKEREKKEI